MWILFEIFQNSQEKSFLLSTFTWSNIALLFFAFFCKILTMIAGNYECSKNPNTPFSVIDKIIVVTVGYGCSIFSVNQSWLFGFCWYLWDKSILAWEEPVRNEEARSVSSIFDRSWKGSLCNVISVATPLRSSYEMGYLAILSNWLRL